jgi:hypothetical protein
MVEKRRAYSPPTSFPTPAEKATLPTVIFNSFISVRILQRTANAVIE